MPTILRVATCRFYFYSHEPGEPPHVHVDSGGSSVKIWLDPVSMAKSRGFRPREINAILVLVAEHHALLLEAWHEYFGTDH